MWIDHLAYTKMSPAVAILVLRETSCYIFFVIMWVLFEWLIVPLRDYVVSLLDWVYCSLPCCGV